MPILQLFMTDGSNSGIDFQLDNFAIDKNLAKIIIFLNNKNDQSAGHYDKIYEC